MITVRVPLADRGYDVVVGHGARAALASLVPRTARRAAVVTQPGIPFEVDPGVPAQRFDIGAGEQHKHLGTVEALCRGFARMGLTRHDVVVSVGGGLVSDVAGFAASVWHRGVPVIHVTTTLLGMVDAAIGGKTGVNLPEGKNLVGAFWQPVGVVCDLDALATLPEREVRCGRGEMAKYHFLTGENLLALPEAERVARCVAIKAEVVAGDEREDGRRALLNYGHTLAHALEVQSGHDLAHGEAVAVGLAFAAHLAEQLGRIDAARVQQHYDVVEGEYGLSARLPHGADHDALVELMARDKKALDGLTFVLDGPSGVEVVAGVAEADVRTVLAAMAAPAMIEPSATPELRTARLLLRGWRDTDRPAYAALNADPEVMRHFPATLTADQSDDMVDRMARGWAERGYGLWAVDRLDTGEFIGFVGLSSPGFVAHFTPCVEVGWRLARAHWGNGFAPEAARAALAWGWQHVRPPGGRFVSFTTEANTNSRRVMEKLGMTHDPADDFDHPMLPHWEGRRHVLYRTGPRPDDMAR